MTIFLKRGKDENELVKDEEKIRDTVYNPTTAPAPITAGFFSAFLTALPQVRPLCKGGLEMPVMVAEV